MDLRLVRKQLKLSPQGMCLLLRVDSERTLRDWQRLGAPGHVQNFLDMLLRSREMQQLAGLKALQEQYPYRTVGRPPKAKP